MSNYKNKIKMSNISKRLFDVVKYPKCYFKEFEEVQATFFIPETMLCYLTISFLTDSK
jgi:ABC-type uncharacterized transport system permease subunit